MATSDWAVKELEKLLPLDHDSLIQILEYTSSLSKSDSAEHLKNLLGDTPKALEFISSYNARRQDTASSVTSNAAAQTEQRQDIDQSVPKSTRKGQKKKHPLHALPSRQIEGQGNVTGGYKKGSGDDYISSNKPRRDPEHDAEQASTFALSSTPDARQLPKKTLGKLPPSAAGTFISDLPNVKSKSQMSSRNASPAPSKTKVTVQGGVAGKGASSTLEDLDAAIRALEFQTNPTLSTTSSSSSSSADRTCTCNATRHPLSTVAPNCLNCGKIICLKEGIGPCTFCSTPLLSSAQIVDMLDSLKQERGAERMRVNNAGHARPATTTIASSSSTLAPAHSSSSSAAAGVGKADETLNKAEEHRNRLLAFQRENAKRTTVHDEAADYETTTSSWASPAERARQLQRQLKVKREQDWAARPEWEKRGKVLSINLGKGGKVSRTVGVEMGARDMGKEDEGLEEGEVVEEDGGGGGTGHGLGHNPLMGAGMIRPIWTGKGKGREIGGGDGDEGREKRKGWRRVQDDWEDNEGVILDGGVYGGQEERDEGW